MKALITFGSCCIFVLAMFIGASLERKAYRKQAIERGFAEYNSTTGEWQWKEQNISNLTNFYICQPSINYPDIPDNRTNRLFDNLQMPVYRLWP